jgi:HK97 family phage major capsid protein
MDRIPIYLIALIVALAHMTTNIYDVHAWNLGTVKAEPWRTKVSTGALRVTSAIRACVQMLWCHRRGVAIAGVCALAILAPSVLSGHDGAGATIGIAISIPQLESDLRAKQAAAKDLMEKTMRTCAEAVVKPATATTPEEKGRLMTADEKAAIQAMLDEAKGVKARIDEAQGQANLQAEIDRLTAGMTDRPPAGPTPSATPQTSRLSFGEQFVSNAAFRDFIKNGGHRSSGAWMSPAVELQATTLDTTSGSGGQLIVTDFQPGILPLLFKRLTVADLIAPGTTTSNSITYFKETTATNAAAAVAEGAAKPESTLIFALQSDLVRKIANWLPVTEEMLEDADQIRSYIDMRLRLFVALAEEDQLLNGSGVAPNIQGILQRTGLTPAQARGADTNADCIFKMITTIASTVFIQPDGLVLNPINWQTIQLTKNANGNYLGTGPWQNAQPPQLWGYPAAITPSIAANLGLVGAFKAAAQFFRKGGVRVEVSNSHADFFVKNLVAIRAEERGALAVYRPAAFGTCTGLN